MRNTAGNPLYGTADAVRKETAMNIGKMIRDGYPATTILSEAMGEVARDSGEKYGGGGVNLVSGISTSDMFTPKEMNSTGYPMDEEYSKVCDNCGWALGYPAAEAHERCPICNSEIRTVYAYQALGEALTISSNAVAVSVYNKEKSYNAVNMLFNAGVRQINFHVIAHDKSYKRILSIIDDLKTDERIKGKVKAVVLLKYKPKGNGVGKFNHLTDEQYREIISYAENNGVSIGFDSCSAHAYLRTIKNDPDFEKKSLCVEPCESSCFSSYINHKGEFYACSFCEGEGMWKNGINVLNCNDFEQDVWNGEQTKTFRKILLDNKRKCPMYKLD